MKFPSNLNCDGKIVSEMGPWPDLSHLCSNFLLSRFAAAISSLYQGALGLTVTRRWQSGACLSASSVKVELYCVTRAETLSAGVVTKADWATSNVKSLISTFFHFRYETFLDRKVGLSAAKLKITELWSETTCPWTDTLLTMFSVMTRSSTWPWTWVGFISELIMWEWRMSWIIGTHNSHFWQLETSYTVLMFSCEYWWIASKDLHSPKQV